MSINSLDILNSLNKEELYNKLVSINLDIPTTISHYILLHSLVDQSFDINTLMKLLSDHLTYYCGNEEEIFPPNEFYILLEFVINNCIFRTII